MDRAVDLEFLRTRAPSSELHPKRSRSMRPPPKERDGRASEVPSSRFILISVALFFNAKMWVSHEKTKTQHTGRSLKQMTRQLSRLSALKVNDERK